jgi:methyltransferase, fkbM family
MPNNIIYPEIYQKLVDEESQVYYMARQNHMADSRLSSFYQIIRELHIEYKFRDIENFLISNSSNGWIIWGHDDVALYHYLLLQDSKYTVVGVTDFESDLETSVVSLVRLEHAVELVNNEGYSILITQEQYTDRVKSLFNLDRVLVVDNHLVGRCGWQYFDFFEPSVNEVFIDGGSLDGKSSVEFTKWSKGAYGAIYAFEPNPKMVQECTETLNMLSHHDVYFYNCALWNCKCKLNFNNESRSKWDACVSSDGIVSVEVDSLDNIIGQNRVTFIKLDVEGSELETLMGAAEIIKRDHPRMAISVYHKKDDLFDVAHYVLSLADNYNLAIRHYHSDSIETVLYTF